jgi:hypothetical protein
MGVLTVPVTVPGRTFFLGFFTLLGQNTGALPEKSRGDHFSTSKNTLKLCPFCAHGEKIEAHY